MIRECSQSGSLRGLPMLVSRHSRALVEGDIVHGFSVSIHATQYNATCIHTIIAIEILS
jgi:hypothetical protein